ncbi:MAG TPA: VOC family protein [Solirubrobacteraceae bacterium]|jgi:catechol 2,3-dioxygenase-like lactoylglutathione lyase family enzyme|nr:VOC family protein [Solirubrobacteraceae bacterium]
MPVRRAAIDHLTIGVSNLERSRAFYEAILAPLGLTHTQTSEVLPGEVEFGTESEHPFAISTDYPSDAPVHVAFGADSVEQVQAFHEAALAAGGTENGAPGLRPEYSPVYYGAFVLDPDGHNIEAVTRV